MKTEAMKKAVDRIMRKIEREIARELGDISKEMHVQEKLRDVRAGVYGVFLRQAAVTGRKIEGVSEK